MIKINAKREFDISRGKNTWCFPLMLVSSDDRKLLKDFYQTKCSTQLSILFTDGTEILIEAIIVKFQTTISASILSESFPAIPRD